MKTARKTIPIPAAVTPSRMESRPRDAPTVSSCRYFREAGSARAQHLGQLVRLLGGEAAGDLAFGPDLALDGGGGGHGPVEDDGEALADAAAGLALELVGPGGVERELHVRLVVLPHPGARGLEVAAGDDRLLVHEVE